MTNITCSPDSTSTSNGSPMADDPPRSNARRPSHLPRRSHCRTRRHLSSYALLSTPYHFLDDHTPFHLPSLLLNNLPRLPNSVDTRIDSSLYMVDQMMEQNWERLVVRPQERIRTGVAVYKEWGKTQLSGRLRQLEEGILDFGEHFLPTEEEGEAEDDDDHVHGQMNGYWTSTTNSTVDSVGEDRDHGSIKSHSSKDGKLHPFTPAGNPHDAKRADGTSEPETAEKSKAANAHGLPPYRPEDPAHELQTVGSLVYTYARRTYLRNKHKTAAEMLHDVVDLAKVEARRKMEGLDDGLHFERVYWEKMREVGK